MQTILRYFIHPSRVEESAAEIIDCCRRIGCTQVLLFTSPYDEMPSFPGVEWYREYISIIKPCIQRFRDAGITVGINVLQTLGHIYYPESCSDFGFQRRVNINGDVSHAGACPLDNELRLYTSEVYKLWAELEPNVIFVDDDYRNILGEGLQCFCPLHMESISGHYGSTVTREQMADALHKDSTGSMKLRRACQDALSSALVSFAEEIYEAVTSVSPNTRLGIMTANVPGGLFGEDIHALASALAGDNRPLVRPQVGIYTEPHLHSIPGVLLNPSFLRDACGQDIELWVEMENYPFTSYSKSAQMTLLQMTICLLLGNDKQAINIFDLYGHPLSDNEDIVAMLEEKRPYMEAISRLVPSESPNEGIRSFIHKDSPAVRRCEPSGAIIDGRPYDTWLPNLGLPMGFKSSAFNFIAGDDILALDDQQIGELLKAGAVMDARALECLWLRGFGERVGVKCGEAINIDNVGYETFTSAEFNPKYQNRLFPLRAFSQPGHFMELQAESGGISFINNYKGERVSPSVVVTENADGERFAVLAHTGINSPYTMENTPRAEQLKNVFEWVARKPLPVCVIDRPYVWPILSRDTDRELITLGLVNLSTETYKDLLISLPDYSQGYNHVYKVEADGNLYPIVPQLESGEYVLRIPCTLAPVNALVVVFGKEEKG